MKNRKITVWYYRGKTEVFSEKLDRYAPQYGDFTLDYEEAMAQFNDDVSTFQKTFTKFTNQGKVSQSDPQSLALDFLKEAAEKEWTRLEALEREVTVDMERAKILAKIVNQASENLTDGEIIENGRIISHKISRSKWYESAAGEGHTRSQYDYYVPASVFEEAKELQGIRKKHEGSLLFDFYETHYRKAEVRTSDHDNDFYLAGVSHPAAQRKREAEDEMEL